MVKAAFFRAGTLFLLSSFILRSYWSYSGFLILVIGVLPLLV